MNRENNTIIVCGFPGVGKTTAFNQLKARGVRVLDSDSSTFNKEHFPQNYLEHISQVVSEGKVDCLFVSTHALVINGLKDLGFNFNIVYPDKNLKEDYLERYRRRNSPDNLIKIISDNWSQWIDVIDDLSSTKIYKFKLTNRSETLMDVLYSYFSCKE